MNISHRTNLVLMLLIALATGVAFWVGQDAQTGLTTGAIMLVVVLVLHFGAKRSDTIETMSGIGDERVRSLSTRAMAFVGTVYVVVIPTWWLVSVATGRNNETTNILCAIGGVAFVLASLVLARRG